jgi:signal transduction histidine kinase
MNGGKADSEPSETHVPWHVTVLRISPLVLLPLAAVLLMTLAVAASSELAARRAQENSASIAQALLRLEALGEVRGLITDAETGQRGFLLTGDPAYLEPFTRAARAMPDSIARLRELSSGSEAFDEGLDRASSLMAERLTIASDAVREFERSGRDAAIALVKSGAGNRLMDALRVELARLDALTRADLDTLQSERLASARWSRARLLVLTLLSLGLIFLLTREFARAAVRQDRQRRLAEHEARHLERLIAARTEELSQLSTHLQHYAEKEKSQLGHDLHDELGSLLTAAKMDLSWLQDRLAEGEVAERLAQLGRALDDAMDVKRRVVEDLRPSLLEHFGIATALRAYIAGSCGKKTIRCETAIDDSLDGVIPRETAITLFRVAQEGLTNVLRHADAGTVRIELGCEADRYRLSIRDDGRGFDASAVRSSHGVSGMRHRVRAIGGEFKLESSRGGGTHLLAWVPRTRAQTAREDSHLERASATSALSSEMSRILSRK